MDERIMKVLTHKATIPAAIGVVSFGVGFGVGYLINKRKEKVQLHVVPPLPNFEVDAQKETELAEEHFLNRPAETVTEADAEELPQVDELLIVPDEVEEPAAIPRNVFAQNGEAWDYEEELKKRTETEPYVLHQDEFFANERGYTQETLTWYAGDDLMADQNDVLVYNYAEKVGPLQFGRGSNSDSVFYARNDQLRTEYEIVRHDGSYAFEVQGLEQEGAEAKELKHSGVEKFRD